VVGSVPKIIAYDDINGIVLIEKVGEI